MYIQQYFMNLVIAFRQKSGCFLILISFFLCILIAIYRGLYIAIDIPTEHLDGAYQTASSLYRLNVGQYPGKDFFPYLGIGPIFILYPFFKTFGSTIGASVFASNFILVILRFLSVWIVAFICSKTRKSITASVVSSLFLLLSLPILNHWFIPGNSLRPIRGFIPYFIAICLYLIIKSDTKLIRKYDFILIGFITSISLLWSNDFAISTSFFTMFFFYIYKAKQKKLTFKILLSSIFVTLLSTTFMLYVSTNDHILDFLSYNFIDVRRDQHWYFAPYVASEKIFDATDFLRKIFFHSDILPITFLILLFFKINKNNLESYLSLWIALVLFSGGAIASIGGHFEIGYFFEYHCFVYIYTYISLILMLINRIDAMQKYDLHSILKKFIISFLCILTFILGLSINNYSIRLASTKADTKKFYVRTLGGYLPIEYKNHVDLARQFLKDEVIEEYWGLWSALNNKVGQSNLPVDSTIHALGSIRYKYLQILEKLPDRVITTPYFHSQEWQPWNLSLNYWFYKVILENYEPIQTSPSTLVWNKSVNKKGSEILCVVNGARNHFSLATKNSGYYEVKLDADVSLKNRSLALIRNNINYAKYSNGYIPIDSESNSFLFPVFIPQKSKNLDSDDEVFDVKFSQPDETVENDFKISSCKAYAFHRNHPQVTPLISESTF